MNLFASNSGFEEFNFEGGSVLFNSSFIGHEKSIELFRTLNENVSWGQQQLKMYGKIYDIPRLTAWYGDSGTGYKYSGIMNEPLPWIPVLDDLKNKIESACADWDFDNAINSMNAKFNSLLINKYRDGNDKVSWHCDDEKEFGINPVIASLSLGATRKFQVRSLDDKTDKKEFLLNSGSLIIMKGAFQHNWEHQIPLQKTVSAPRLNLTFRKVII